MASHAVASSASIPMLEMLITLYYLQGWDILEKHAPSKKSPSFIVLLNTLI
jgi:hypothetical protein